MTTEEQLEKLQADFDALSLKNKDLIGEKRKLQSKVGEIDFDAYNKAMEENDTLKGQVSKLNSDLGLKTKDVEKLSTSLNELETNLKTTKLENTLNEELSKLNLNPTLLRLVKNDFKNLSKFNEDGSILVSDKPLKDYVSEWLNTDEGKAATMPSGNAGSGASGGNGSANLTGKLDGSKSEQEAYIKAKFNL